MEARAQHEASREPARDRETAQPTEHTGAGRGTAWQARRDRPAVATTQGFPLTVL